MDDKQSNTNPLTEALNIDNLPTTEIVNQIMVDAHDDSAKTDFETARSNILDMIENGQDAMYKLSQIASSSQHPRAYEVYAKLMETMLQANKDLMDLQVKIREITAADAPMNEKAQTINNNLFVGSTAELQKMIENVKNGGQS